MSQKQVQMKVVVTTCDLCGSTSSEVHGWSGSDSAGQFFLPRGWRRREVNGVKKHVCDECLEAVQS